MTAAEACTLALAKMLEAQALLEVTYEDERLDPSVDAVAALGMLEDAIAMLSPLEPDGEPSSSKLRLVSDAHAVGA